MTTAQKVLIWLGKHGAEIPAGPAEELRRVLGDAGYEDALPAVVPFTPPPFSPGFTTPYPIVPNVAPPYWTVTCANTGGSGAVNLVGVMQ